MSRKRPWDELGGMAARGVAVQTRLIRGLRRPRTTPRTAVWLTWLPLRHLCREMA